MRWFSHRCSARRRRGRSIPKGLARFDGDEFTNFDLSAAAKVRNSAVNTIAAASEGGLWIGLENSGFGYFDGHSYSAHSREAWGGEYINVQAILQDHEGAVWLGMPTGGERA